MSHRVVVLLALLSPGCVPVTEPVGDIDTAEPRKDLIGTWKDDEQPPRLWVVDRPEVKGNPKGLMRVRIVEAGKKLEDLRPDDALWFFVASAGKDTYANGLDVEQELAKKNREILDLSRGGDYARWTRNKNRGYFIASLKIDGTRITVDPGNEKAFSEIMKANKFPKVRDIFQTPAGWLTKYLEQNDPGKIFTRGKAMWNLTKATGK